MAPLWPQYSSALHRIMCHITVNAKSQTSKIENYSIDVSTFKRKSRRQTCCDGISCDVAPRSAELDILIVVVIATSLASTALKLRQHILLRHNFLCQKIDETS